MGILSSTYDEGWMQSTYEAGRLQADVFVRERISFPLLKLVENGPLNPLQEQCIDAMSVHHLLASRPGEDGEATILRSNQGKGILLVMDELCR